MSLQDFIAYRKDIYEDDADLISEATQDYLDHDPKYLEELQDEYDRLGKEIERVRLIQDGC